LDSDIILGWVIPNDGGPQVGKCDATNNKARFSRVSHPSSNQAIDTYSVTQWLIVRHLLVLYCFRDTPEKKNYRKIISKGLYCQPCQDTSA
jgi:hypothetical protein